MTDDNFREYTLDQLPEGEHLREWERHDWTREEEAFAKEMIRCGNRTRAFKVAFSQRAAGMSIGGIQTAARKLEFQPWMQDYLAYDQERTKELMRRSGDEILDEITKIAKANMADFYTVDEYGNPAFDLSGLTRAQSSAISELQIDTYVAGRGEDAREVKSIKMKLSPKTAALELLGKNQKLFVEVMQHENVGDEIEEMRRARERARKRAAGEGLADDGEED